MNRMNNLITPVVVYVNDLFNNKTWLLPFSLIEQDDVLVPAWIPGRLHSSVESIRFAAREATHSYLSGEWLLNGKAASFAEFEEAWRQAIDHPISCQLIAGTRAESLIDNLRFKLTKPLPVEQYESLQSCLPSSVRCRSPMRAHCKTGTLMSVELHFDFSKGSSRDAFFDIEDKFKDIESNFQAVVDSDHAVYSELIKTRLLKPLA